MEEFIKDKNGNKSLRELITIICMLCIIISWIAQQFYGKQIPEFIFFSFVSLVGASCFGYSIEKKSNL